MGLTVSSTARSLRRRRDALAWAGGCSGTLTSLWKRRALEAEARQNLGKRGREQLKAEGHDVSTVAEQGLTSSADDMLVAVCAAEGRALVTLDLDFANPLRFDPAKHQGIALVSALCVALRSKGQLWIVERRVESESTTGIAPEAVRGVLSSRRPGHHARVQQIDASKP